MSRLGGVAREVNIGRCASKRSVVKPLYSSTYRSAGSSRQGPNTLTASAQEEKAGWNFARCVVVAVSSPPLPSRRSATRRVQKLGHLLGSPIESRTVASLKSFGAGVDLFSGVRAACEEQGAGDSPGEIVSALGSRLRGFSQRAKIRRRRVCGRAVLCRLLPPMRCAQDDGSVPQPHPRNPPLLSWLRGFGFARTGEGAAREARQGAGRATLLVTHPMRAGTRSRGAARDAFFAGFLAVVPLVLCHCHGPSFDMDRGSPSAAPCRIRT